MGYVYLILNLVNNKFYLGSTNNVSERKRKHFNLLKKGKHHSSHLQYSYDKYGEESFIFIIIETTTEHKKREQYLLDHLDFSDMYNVSKHACGGDTTYNHPLGRESLKQYGQTNGMWKDGMAGKTYCKCGTMIRKRSKLCISCFKQTFKRK